MSRPAIVVENLSKKFRLGTGGGPSYHRLSEMLTGLPRFAYNKLSPRRTLNSGSPRPASDEAAHQSSGSPRPGSDEAAHQSSGCPRPASGRGAGGEGPSSVSQPTANHQPPIAPQSGEFWALKDVSFEVQPGEVVGIIGRNGAGKSTLLKILSRITEPTSGRFGVRGRVASLLEVGTGFHPELTGRENIYVSGITLGMTRAEIKKRFDEIVDFSGVEKFLDTPVKHFSSGMQVRLGFAVAAHLESEILIIDEVLAVGDGDFQKKCLSKMSGLRTQGRTVLIVSHHMQMVASLCTRGVVLANGAIDCVGSASRAVDHYLGGTLMGQSYVFETSSLLRRIGDDVAELHRAWVSNEAGEPSGTFDLSEPITVAMEYSVHEDLEKTAFPNFHIFDERGDYVFCTTASSSQLGPFRHLRGTYQASCVIPARLLNTGSFTIGVAVTYLHPALSISFFEREALRFQVTEDFDATIDDYRHGYSGPIPGPIRPDLKWKIIVCEARK